jgi:hypothetical protein
MRRVSLEELKSREWTLALLVLVLLALVLLRNTLG